MHEQEIEWQSYVGVTYDLQATTDFVNWSTVVTVQGNGAKQSHVVQTSKPDRKFRLRESHKEGNEPLAFKAITAWDGTYVILEWSLVASPATPTAHFKILRDNQQLITVPFLSYHNSYQHNQPGTGRHTYSVQFYN